MKNNLKGHKENLKFVGKSMLKFMLLSICVVVCMAIMVGLAYVDISNDGKIQDASYTENLQESLLLFSTIIFMYLAKKYNKDGLYMVGGFLLCMFIREWDAVFDNLFHGAWKYFAIPTAVLFTYLGIRKGVEKAADDLSEFIKSNAYNILVIGLIIVLAVSRLLGTKAIWLLMSSEDFKYVFKSFVEEGTELLGYMTIFAGSVYYYILSRKK